MEGGCRNGFISTAISISFNAYELLQFMAATFIFLGRVVFMWEIIASVLCFNFFRSFELTRYCF